MIGYTTEKQAKINGFTHHGSYYGIPIWINAESEMPEVMAKFLPFELFFFIFSQIELLLIRLTNMDGFMFKIGKPIKDGE